MSNAPPSNWKLSQIPDLSGKVAMVTGENIGLGYKSALELARRNAHVVIACRSPDKGAQARKRIRAEAPGASVEVIHLDLTDISSVRGAPKVINGSIAGLEPSVSRQLWAVSEEITGVKYPRTPTASSSKRTRANHTVTLGAPTNATVSTTARAGDAEGAITDNDAAPTGIELSLNPAGVDEDAGDAETVTVTATLTGGTTIATAKTVAVVVGNAGDTATEGTDYEEVTGFNLAIPAETATGTASFDLTPTDDDVREGDETLTVTGSEAGGTSVKAASLTITDDETARAVTLVLTPATIDESGSANVSTVTARLSAAASADVELMVAAAPVDPAVAGDITLSTNKTLTIAAGDTTSTGAVTITAVDNDIDAANKTVTVSATVMGGHGAMKLADVTLTIEDDDTRGVTVSAATSGVTVAEADVAATMDTAENETTYTVVLDSEPSAGTVTVNLASGDTDIATVKPASLAFDADDWATPQTFTVTGVDDDIDNANDRRTTDITHTVSAAGTDYVGVTSDEVTVTVTDDDAAPTDIELTVDTDSVESGNQASVGEGAGDTTVSVTAALSGDTRFSADRTIAVTVGKAGDAAVSDVDYEAVAGFNITIAAGTSTGTGSFTLDPTDDEIREGAEKISVTGASTGITVTAASITIADDEGPPTATLVLGAASSSWRPSTAPTCRTGSAPARRGRRR